MTAAEANLWRTVRDFGLALVAVCDEQIAGTAPPMAAPKAPPPHIDLSQFDAKWKTGQNLSALGKIAIFAAFDRFLPQNAVARLFQITRRSAHRYHEEWKAQRTAQIPTQP